MLAMHKDVQNKAFAEIRNCFVTANNPIDLNAVNNLPYLEMVIKETMRLFPSASIVGRYTSDKVYLGIRDEDCD